MTPSDTQTSNQLQGAGSALERLLKLGIDGYTAVTGAKAASTADKLALAEANRTGVSPATPNQPSTGISPTMLYVAGGLVAVVVLVAALRK